VNYQIYASAGLPPGKVPCPTLVARLCRNKMLPVHSEKGKFLVFAWHWSNIVQLEVLSLYYAGFQDYFWTVWLLQMRPVDFLKNW